MRRRLSLFVLLASPCVFLASLYLLWVESSPIVADTSTKGPLSLLNLFAGGFGGVSFYGWAGPYGQAAALVALALAFGAGVSLFRPQLETRLPLASAGLAMLYLAVLNAQRLQGGGVFQAASEHRNSHLATGAYLGIASAVVALLAAIGAHWEEVARRPSVPGVVAFLLTMGLLAAFILPWLHIHVPRVAAETAGGYQLSEFDIVVNFIALLGCFSLPLWGPGTPPGRRLAAALGLLVLVGGTLERIGVHAHWSYEAWLQLGCSLGLVALAVSTNRGLRISPLPLSDAAAVVAGSLLAGSMFLPWQKFCSPGGRVCGSTSGWGVIDSAMAGGLAVILLVLLLSFRHLFAEVAVGAAIYVVAAGFWVTQAPQLGSGASLGFAGAALLLVAAARKLVSVPPDRLLVRWLPVVAGLAFLAIPVATLTGRLSPTLEADSPWRMYWPWLELGAILVGLRLLGRWLAGPEADDELVLLPLALLAVTVLDVVEAQRASGISWESWLSIDLCLLLVGLGWFERSRGLERLRIPEEIWRIDRLPGES